MSSATLNSKPIATKVTPTSPSKYLLDVDIFNQMINAGIFTKDDRLELLNGEIIEMTPIGARHSSCVRKLTRLLGQATTKTLDIQNPLILNGQAEVYPDLAILKEDLEAYNDRKPNADDALMLIEVSDSTLHFDRNEKLPRYAEAGISEVWIIDLQNERILVHKRPLDGVYGNVNEYKRGDTLKVAELEDVSFDVDDILP